LRRADPPFKESYQIPNLEVNVDDDDDVEEEESCPSIILYMDVALKRSSDLRHDND